MAMAGGVEYLRSFPDFEQGNVQASSAFGLQRVLALLEEVGSPHLKLRVIHLAGTKGKGSTAAMIEAIMRAAGLSTGLFTQPHLLRLNERFQVDGAQIDNATLDAIMLETIQPAVERLARRGIVGIQQFEAQVALALSWFDQRGVDVAVLETGLGGRLDGTNVVPRPLVTVLTPIGHDHMQVLGDTLPQIAAEKAAIIKAGVPVVAAPQAPEVETVFERFSAERAAPLLLGGHAWQVQVESVSEAGTICTLQVDAQALQAAGVQAEHLAIPVEVDAGMHVRLQHLFTPLLGQHQAVNAAAAALAAIVASPRLPGVRLDAIHAGLAAVRWPGRLQILAREPLIVLDGAHTPESAQALVDALQDLWPGRRALLVCGLQGDKDLPGFAGPVAHLARWAVATQAAHPRAAAADRVAAALREAGLAEVEEVGDPWLALQRARARAAPADLFVVTGSLYLVGALLREWEDRESARPTPV
jgi:dihydrofolate synthase/folylpolyglutamate synthase